MLAIQSSGVSLISVNPTGQIIGGNVYIQLSPVFKAGALTAAANLFGMYPIHDTDAYGLTTTGSMIVRGFNYVHKTSTTVGATTIILKRHRSGSDTSLATLTVPDGTVVFTKLRSTDPADEVQSGDVFWFDVTGVGGTPPSDVSLCLVIVVGTGN